MSWLLLGLLRFGFDIQLIDILEKQCRHFDSNYLIGPGFSAANQKNSLANQNKLSELVSMSTSMSTLPRYFLMQNADTRLPTCYALILFFFCRFLLLLYVFVFAVSYLLPTLA